MFVKAEGTGAEPPVKIQDIPLYNIKAWLDEFWAKASEDEKAWLKIEFKEWLLKKEQLERKDASPPEANLNAG